jgi:hypothetical protein
LPQYGTRFRKEVVVGMAHGKTSFAVGALALSLAGSMAGGACGGEMEKKTGAPGDVASGAVALTLDGSGDLSLDLALYVINGPGQFSLSGSIDLAQSTTLTATIGGIPAGRGYSIVMTAMGNGGAVMCDGTAPALFDVAAGATTPVAVHLTCHEVTRTGTVIVNGSPNICPVVDAITVTPGGAVVGDPVMLAASTRDLDGGPAPLSYAWSATLGTLSAPSAPTPIFTCTSMGLASVSVTVSDGDTTPGCAASRSLSFYCAPPFALVPREDDVGPGETALFTVLATDGAAHPAWTYTWSDGLTGPAAGQFQPAPTGPGAVAVTYAPASCDALGNVDQEVIITVTVFDLAIAATTSATALLTVHCASS